MFGRPVFAHADLLSVLVRADKAHLIDREIDLDVKEGAADVAV